MEALIPFLPVIAPLFNFVIWPLYRHFMAKIDGLAKENAKLNKRLHDLELTIYRDFRRKNECARVHDEISTNRVE